MNTINKLLKLPVISAIARYWVLFTVLALLAVLLITNVLFAVVGAMLWIPALVLGCMGSALLLRNVFNAETTDKDVDSGKFEAEWGSLDSKTRITLTVVQILVYFLGACIVAAAIAMR